MEIDNKNLFDLSKVTHSQLFENTIYPWEVVKKLSEFVVKIIEDGKSSNFPGAYVADNVVIGKGTMVEPGAVIFGPTYIGENCVIRSGAYIRGNVYIDENVVIGHSSEIKNSVILSGAQIAHFNYVGDSIIGNNGHLAAGAIIANTKLSNGNVSVKNGGEILDTGLKKFGAALGDDAEVGANAVLNPGSIVGNNSVIYPLVSWRGNLEKNSIAKTSSEVTLKK